MTTGVVKTLVDGHGYGFVSSTAGKDIFFHYSGLQGVKFNTLREGQSVIYRVGLCDKGLIARDIRPCVV